MNTKKNNRMNSQKIYPHPTIGGALLFVSPLGNITITNECMFKTGVVPPVNAEEIAWDISVQAMVNNAKMNSINLLCRSACEIFEMLVQEKAEDFD
jgi:hypothetical protein